MPLIDPETPDDGFAYLDEATASFLRAIKDSYTRDTAVDVMDALTPILGKAWKGRVILGIVANKHNTIRRIRIMIDPLQPQLKINAIKAVRAISGGYLGLTEAKKIVEDAYFKTQEISLSNYMEQTVNDPSARMTIERRIASDIEDIRRAGFRVEAL